MLKIISEEIRKRTCLRLSLILLFFLAGVSIVPPIFLIPILGEGNELVNQIIYIIFAVIVILLLSFSYYADKINRELKFLEFLFGYEKANLRGSDAFIYRLTSSIVWKFIKSYPFTTLFIIHWASPLPNLLKFWYKLKTLIEPFDLFGYIGKFEELVLCILSRLTPCMLAYKDGTQIVINILYIMLISFVTFITLLRIRFSSLSESD